MTLVDLADAVTLDDPFTIPIESYNEATGAVLVPLGGCPVCWQPVPGTTDRRHQVCRVRLGLHQHPTIPMWCIGTNALVRPLAWTVTR